MQRRTTTIALAAILIPTVCFAWGRDGHRITGFIAAKYLTPQAAAAVKDLLGEQTLADVSTWPDEIRRQRKHTAPWHYANPAPGSDGFNLERDCPEEGCVVSAIIKWLIDPGFPRCGWVDGTIYARHTCNPMVLSQCGRSIQWVTGENGHFAFNSTAN